MRRDGKLRELGHFTDETEAAKAYNEAAKRHYGEYALLNDIPNNKNSMISKVLNIIILYSC